MQVYLSLCMQIIIKIGEQEVFRCILYLKKPLIKKLGGSCKEEKNRSDLFGNVDFSSESSEVTNILIDLTKEKH